MAELLVFIDADPVIRPILPGKQLKPLVATRTRLQARRTACEQSNG